MYLSVLGEIFMLTQKLGCIEDSRLTIVWPELVAVALSMDSFQHYFVTNGINVAYISS